MKVDTNNLLSQALAEVLGRNRNQKQRESSCALVVSFTDFTYHQEFMEIFHDELGEFFVLDDCLVRFYPNQATAQERANFISSVIFNYGNAILKLPFDPDWLDTYLELGRFGVNCGMANHLLTSSTGLDSYRIKRAEDRAKSDAYKTAQDKAADECMMVTLESLIGDFTKFIIDNFTGWPVEETVRKTIARMAVSIQADMEDVHYLPRHPAQTIWYALGSKEEYCLLQRGVPEKDVVSKVIRRTDLDDKYLVKRSVWEECSKSIRSILQRYLPNLDRIGLSVLLEDEDATIPDSVPFAGISFKHDWQLCMDGRLSAENLRYDVQEQGRDLLTSLAGAFAAYYLGIVEIRQEQKLERLLREFSRKMDQESFVDNIPRLLHESLDNIAAS